MLSVSTESSRLTRLPLLRTILLESLRMFDIHQDAILQESVYAREARRVRAGERRKMLDAAECANHKPKVFHTLD